ncbi:MAG: DUF6209 family protein [Verrucomicrobiota bacterium]
MGIASFFVSVLKYGDEYSQTDGFVFCGTSAPPLRRGHPAGCDLSRQSHCRGMDWSVIASLTAPGHTPTVLYLPGTERTGALERTISVPLDTDVWLWFEGRDRGDCHSWDSNYGNDFHFTPERPARVVHLLSGLVSRVEGTLQAGAPFGVDFDLQRLPFCIARTGDGRFLGEATMYHRFDGGAITETKLLTPPPSADGSPGQLALAPTLTPPVGARLVELWVHAADAYGCSLWDSNYGANYRFAIAP